MILKRLRQHKITLFKTIEETLQIQEEGRQKRQQAEADLKLLESDLKERLTTAKVQRNQQ
ncbi:tellurite resistance protein [Staphylococcus schleiferi]|uniref:Tellurite resistance protein n=1 Tax=Staphylococcus schleiferi TaxID=1295 RepID=A0A7Z7QQ30_STASC|nr:tellurite resistance protein [Staphylococcus schleiferi]SUM88958.1 tellurite resistance protein [Staphylococcus schleiferi]